MRRRDFNASLLIAGPAMQSMLAQISERPRALAIVVSFGKPEAISEAGSGFWRAFFEELRRLGHVEGRDLIIERYSAEGHFSRYTDLARDVVSLNPDVIFLERNNRGRLPSILPPSGGI
jgi:putative ABC transport system substrate-binding protein